jgi:3-oxoacyl-[acyl-carrier-protein] synthase III
VRPFGGAGCPGALYMNGAEIFNFTAKTVPAMVNAVLERAGCGLGDVDLVVCHQANRFLLEHLRKKMCIPRERFYVSLEDCGNTVSCTIPIALKRASEEGVLRPGHKVLLAGFGVGYSWAGTMVRWTGLHGSAAEAAPAVESVLRV